MFTQAFKTIIVGVDFSPYSKTVVRQAQLLSKSWKTKLVYVHAFHDSVDYVATDPFGVTFFPNFIDANFYVKKIKKHYNIKKGSEKIVARMGSPFEVLTELANKHPRSLIMVGHKGHSKIAEFFIGSTSQRLVLKGKTPVWVQRGRKIIDPKRILIPHDLSKSSDKSLAIVKKLSLAHPTKYEVYHVNHKPLPILDYKHQNLIKEFQAIENSNLEQLIKKYPRIPVTSETGEVTQKIAKRSKQFDLLVMAHHTPTNLFTKGQAIALLKKIRTPVMVTH
jgi:nucleotide-binding universal stress UspA family protein